MPLDAFRRLLEAVEVNGLFKRNKVSFRLVEVKVWAIILYLAGLSTRAMTERYGLIKASREAVRLWVHKLESLAYHGPPSLGASWPLTRPRRSLTENGFTYGLPWT
jgi:transposase